MSAPPPSPVSKLMGGGKIDSAKLVGSFWVGFGGDSFASLGGASRHVKPRHVMSCHAHVQVACSLTAMAGSSPRVGAAVISNSLTLICNQTNKHKHTHKHNNNTQHANATTASFIIHRLLVAFVGSIPSTIGNCTQLEHFSAKNTSISGK